MFNTGEWLSRRQVAVRLGLSTERVDQLRRLGQLGAVETPAGWLYRREAVEAEAKRRGLGGRDAAA